MPSRRLKLVRGRKARIQEQPGATTFGDLPIGGYFFITPKGTIRVGWIKISREGAQLDDWNNDSDCPDQSFLQDFKVYIQ